MVKNVENMLLTIGVTIKMTLMVTVTHFHNVLCNSEIYMEYTYSQTLHDQATQDMI